MGRKVLDPDQKGAFPPESAPAGQEHTFVLRRMDLEHRYHDEDPVQGAKFTLKFPSGYEVEGTLDGKGLATVLGVPAGSGELRYGPDTRPYQRVDLTENPDYHAEMSDQDLDALIDKYQK